MFKFKWEAQIMGVRFWWRLNSVRRRRIFMDSQCVWNLFHVNFLKPRIFKWILHYLENLFSPSLVQVNILPFHQSLARPGIEV